MATFTEQSARWAIFDAIATALETDAQLQGVKVVRNPRTAQHLASGEQLVAVKWGSDSRLEKSGRLERRKFRLTVASLSRKLQEADRDADAMHQAATNVVQRVLEQPTPAPVHRLKSSESDTTTDVENLEVDGALVLSSWEIDYEIRRDV